MFGYPVRPGIGTSDHSAECPHLNDKLHDFHSSDLECALRSQHTVPRTPYTAYHIIIHTHSF